ncbi:MAG: pantetheine-phosphate adenylyltransferase, partial [Angustibacter sp.]
PSRCIVPGSFDPMTLGHLNIVERAAGLFDEVLVAILPHSSKPGRFPPERRCELARLALAEVDLVPPRVSVAAFENRLLVDVCRDWSARAIIRGLRLGADADYELPMAMMNRQISSVETLFLAADPQFGHVSSTLIKQISAYGGSVQGLVPPAVERALAEGR